MSYDIQAIRALYPNFDMQQHDFVEAALPICTHKLDISNNKLVTALQQYFIECCLPYLQDYLSENKPMNKQQVEQVSQWIIASYTHNIICFRDSSSESIMWLLFGDEHYDNFTLVANQISKQSLRVRHRLEPALDYSQGQAILQTIETEYKQMTEYGQTLTRQQLPTVKKNLLYLCGLRK